MIGLAAIVSLMTMHYPPLTASEVETADREVRAVIQTYYRLFNERNPKGMSEELFHLPWIYLDPQGARIFESREGTAKLFEESLSSIVPRGWDHSDFPDPNVCVAEPRGRDGERHVLPLQERRKRPLPARCQPLSRQDAGGWACHGALESPAGESVVL